MACYRLSLAFALLMVLAGCGQPTAAGVDTGSYADDGNAQTVLPTDEPGIVGSITRIGAVDGVANVRGTIRVEQNPAEETSPKDQVKITDATRVLIQHGTDMQTTAFTDLKAGQQVKAWYDGPVAESFPRQATASVILIIDQPAAK